MGSVATRTATQGWAQISSRFHVITDWMTDIGESLTAVECFLPKPPGFVHANGDCIFMKSRQLLDRNGEKIYILVYEREKLFRSRSCHWRAKTVSDPANSQQLELSGPQP